MSNVYVMDSGTQLGIEAGKLKISKHDEECQYIPCETIKSISIYGRSNMTPACTSFCLSRGIPVGFFTESGRYYGALRSTYMTSSARQRKQYALYNDEEFRLEFSKKIIAAKIHNQIVVIKRYFKHHSIQPDRRITIMKNAYRKIENSSSIRQVMGYEGIASRLYFSCWSDLIDESYGFKKRGHRPAKVKDIVYTSVMIPTANYDVLII